MVDENFPNLRNELELGIQEVNTTSNYLNPKRPSPRHIVLKLSNINDKDRILRAAREKKMVTNKRKTHQIIVGLLSTNLTSQKGVESNIQTIK